MAKSVKAGLQRSGHLIERIVRAFAGLAFILTSASGYAGVGVGITPTFPATVKVGQTGIAASVQIAWVNTPPNDTHANNVSGITLTPACGAFVANADCPSAPTDFRQPGIFTFSASGTGVNCGAVTTFTITVIDASSGKIGFTPGFLLPVGSTCFINFTFDVNAMPTKDADSSFSGIQVAMLGAVSATDAVNGNPGSGLGTAGVSFPTISTIPSAGGTLGANGAPPINLSDTATLAGLVPSRSNDPPTGTVTFSLFGPGDPTCAGGPFQSQLVNLTGCTIHPTNYLTNCGTSNTFTVNAAGVWHWTALYSGDADNQSLFSGCAAEPVTINKATPTLQTAPNPPSGTLLATPLGDTADLQGGYFPTGAITFRLYPPSDPNCVGTQSFINSVPVNGNGIYSTSLNYQKALVNQVGTWHWKATYSGDGNNNSVTSPCAAEPVVITQPVLSIVKTPDGATIVAGSTATFTMVVTNQGPGVAKNVVISDPLPAAGTVNWQTSSPGCVITGAVGAQTLNCILGVNFNEGATFTVVVSGATSLGHCAVMTNTATASGTNVVSVNNSADITCQTPVLAIVKTPDNGTITAGQTATFTVVVTNNGPGTATGVAITDPLPPGGGINWQTTTPNCNVTGAIGSQSLNCTVGTMTQGQSFTAVTVAVTTVGKCADLNNTATATATNAASVSDPGKICVAGGTF